MLKIYSFILISMKEKKNFLFRLWLVWLAVASVVIASFTNASPNNYDNIISYWYVYVPTPWSQQISSLNYWRQVVNNVNYDIICIKNWYAWTNTWDLKLLVCDWNPTITLSSSFDTNLSSNSSYCINWWTIPYVNSTTNVSNSNLYCYSWYHIIYVFRNYTWATQSQTISYFWFNTLWFSWFYSCPSCPTCPSQYTSQECQTEYSLIPVSSVDQSYCESNNLCPSWWSSDCPNVWVSNLFINDIFHPWAFNVIINIPQEIDWDYAYTWSWSNFNLDIVWYNVDYTKVQDQIDIQNYKPTTDELSQIVSEIVPLFVPWLAIILLLYFIFRFIKKIF